MWNLTESYSLPVGFAIWALRQDGLRVSPFDAHPAGDGLLRSLGLDAPTWHAWVEGIVRAEDALGEAIATHDLRGITTDERREIRRLDDRRDPVAGWVGDQVVQNALAALWRTYQPIGEAWAHTMTSTKRQSRISAGQERRLWRQMQPFHDSLPGLRVYLVDYPQPVALAVSPASCIVGIGSPDPEGRAFVDLVTGAARELASVQDGRPATP